MEASEVPRAVEAATAIVTALGLAVDGSVVLHDSNRLTLRLLPCDVLARVAKAGDRAAAFEVELAQRLAEADCPVAALEPRVEPRVYETDGFDVTLWTYEPPAPQGVSPGDYADALERLHDGMRTARRHDAALHGSGGGGSGDRRAAATAVRRSRTPTGSSSAARCDA